MTFQFKPMITAPRDESTHVLVLDEWYEVGQLLRGYKLVYWLDSFDGREGGWYYEGRRCNPQGWIISTEDLPIA